MRKMPGLIVGNCNFPMRATLALCYPRNAWKITFEGRAILTRARRFCMCVGKALRDVNKNGGDEDER